jgi:hypothetical protein
MNIKRRKLDLKALEAELPSMEFQEARILLGGSSYEGELNEKELDEIVVTPSHPNDNWNSIFDWGDDYENDKGEEQYNDPDHSDMSEIEFAILYPQEAIQAKMNANTAFEATQDLPGQHNGFGDAARHAYWMALNTLEFGESLARELGVAHENAGTSQGQPQEERDMDLHNNDWGIAYAEEHSDGFSFEEFMADFWLAAVHEEVILIDEESIPRDNIWDAFK